MNKILTTLLSLTVGSAAAQHTVNMGGDISMLPQYEKVSTPYYDARGGRISDVLKWMRDDAKMNSMRVRLFVNPEMGKAKEGVVQDLDYVTKLGKRIKDAGMDFMLDIHYSDTWADPSSQSVPKTWYKGTLSNTNPTDAALQDSVYNYTKRTLEHLAANGAMPDFVQIGNEISYGMLWRTNTDRCYSNASAATFTRFTGFLKQASKAVRQAAPDAKIIVHIERSGDAKASKEFYARMQKDGVDYDIIGLSYYPFWHGDLGKLSTALSTLELAYPDKPVQIVETAYYYSCYPGGTDITDFTKTWAATPEGQKAYIEDLCAELANHANVTGLYYWFPEENGNGGAQWSADKVVLSSWINRGLWDNSKHVALPGIMSLQKFVEKKEALDISAPKTYHVGIPVPLYDLAGRHLSTIPDHGVYISGGKKFVK